MKILCLVILTAMLFVVPCGGASGQVKHPNLLFNRQELAEMKARIEKYPWARQSFDRIKADADADADGGNHTGSRPAWLPRWCPRSRATRNMPRRRGSTSWTT